MAVKYLHLDCSGRTSGLRATLACAHWATLTIVISFLPLVPVAGRAQTRPPNTDVSDLSPEELKTVQVYTASMYLQSDREAPSAVTVVTADQIHKLGYRTLADILNSVRGFYVSYDRNYRYIGVNGLSTPGDYNDRILLLIDGHRMNDNVYGQALIGTEFPLDVDLINRVEIVRGPSSSLYGTSAFFAVVNVIPKSANIVGGMELSTDVSGFGSYRGRASYGGLTHGVEWLLSGTIYESSGASRLFFQAFNSPSTNNGVAENADRDSSRNLFANLRFGHFTLESVISTRHKTIPTASFGTVFNDPRTNTVDAAGYMDLQYNRTLKHDTNITLRLSYDDDAYHGVYAIPPPASQQDAVLNEDLGHGEWLTLNADVTRTLWGKHKVTAGMEFQDNLKQDQTNYNVSPRFVFLDDHRKSIQYAIFIQDELTVTKKLIFNLGVRHDEYETFGGTTNPRLALIFTPVKSATFKFVYGQAFRAPNNYDLYFQDGFSVEANPLLRPEKIKSTELIWDQGLRGNFQLSASAFINRITNLIGQQTDPRNALLIHENSGKVGSKGVEFEFAGKTQKDIEGRVSYTLQRAEDLTTGLSLTNSPTQLLKLNVLWPVWNNRLSIGFEAQGTGRRKTWMETDTRPYAVANITASSHEFRGGFRFSASVYNLFNRKYSDPVGTEIEEPALQQNGRDFRLQITYAFHVR